MSPRRAASSGHDQRPRPYGDYHQQHAGGGVADQHHPRQRDPQSVRAGDDRGRQRRHHQRRQRPDRSRQPDALDAARGGRIGQRADPLAVDPPRRQRARRRLGQRDRRSRGRCGRLDRGRQHREPVGDRLDRRRRRNGRHQCGRPDLVLDAGSGSIGTNAGALRINASRAAGSLTATATDRRHPATRRRPRHRDRRGDDRRRPHRDARQQCPRRGHRPGRDVVHERDTGARHSPLATISSWPSGRP